MKTVEIYLDKAVPCISGIHVIYEDGKGGQKAAPRHFFESDGMESQRFEFVLDKGEYIQSVEVWLAGVSTTHIKGLEFRTNKRGKQLAYGDRSGNSDGTLMAPEGASIISFYGSLYGGMIESLGAYLVRLKPEKAYGGRPAPKPMSTAVGDDYECF